MKQSKISIACLKELASFLHNDVKAIHKLYCGGYTRSAIGEGDEYIETDGKPYCIVNGVIGYMDGQWEFQPKDPVIGEYVFYTTKGFQYVTIIK